MDMKFKEIRKEKCTVLIQNKEKILSALQNNTRYNDKECHIILEVLEHHSIIGQNNKKKMQNEWMEKLNISYDQAEELYELCAEKILKNLFSL